MESNLDSMMNMRLQLTAISEESSDKKNDMESTYQSDSSDEESSKKKNDIENAYQSDSSEDKMSENISEKKKKIKRKSKYNPPLR